MGDVATNVLILHKVSISKKKKKKKSQTRTAVATVTTFSKIIVHN
jgi:hypothetical protein